MGQLVWFVYDKFPPLAFCRYLCAAIIEKPMNYLPGAFESSSSLEGARPPRPVPRPWALGRELGTVGRDLPVRSQASAELGKGAASASGLHLGQDPCC